MKAKLKVLFDAGPLVNGQKSGIGHYSYRLIDTLARSYPNDIELVGHYFDFLGRKHPQLPSHPNISYKSSKLIPGKALAILRRLSLQLPFDLLIKSRGDVVLFPNFVSLPTIQKIKKVVVIHDLCFYDHPEYLQAPNAKFLNKFVPTSVKSADRIVAISQNTKRDITRVYGYPAAKIKIVLPAVDHGDFKPQPSQKVEQVVRKFKINKPYILCLSTIEPRKNMLGVLDSFELLPESIKQSHALVLAGGKGWNDDELNRKYDELANKYTVIKTGYVDDDDLPALYSGASVFVFPALYEGFGIPPLEAMACGTPTITSDNTSLPEVAGEAAIMVKAEDAKALADQIEQILSNKNLTESLSAKGIAQAKQFTWEDSADKLLDTFKELVN